MLSAPWVSSTKTSEADDDGRVGGRESSRRDAIHHEAVSLYHRAHRSFNATINGQSYQQKSQKGRMIAVAVSGDGEIVSDRVLETDSSVIKFRIESRKIQFLY
ncbi:hypothetical protein GPALN_010756 [Globodera pallida]|nr:hypothetical protein GPALN_010756 [Globodera pallida]